VTQVDFYVLGGESAEARLRIACRIADKAMQLDQHVFIRSSTDGEARQLDELLWTFSDSSFVPHKIVGAEPGPAPIEPVLIGVEAAPAGPHPDLLINLAEDVPEYFSDYARIAEIVDAEPERRRKGRERYKYYRERGCKLSKHDV
jgi:DNA polymerase-3 subunit chi